LFPRKCTYAKVIDLRNMALWSVGFIANWHRIPPHQISLCALLLASFTTWVCRRRSGNEWTASSSLHHTRTV